MSTKAGSGPRLQLSKDTARQLVLELRQCWALFDAVTDAVGAIEAGQAKEARARLLPFVGKKPSSPMLLLEAELLPQVEGDVAPPEPVPVPVAAAAKSAATSTAIITEDGAVLEL